MTAATRPILLTGYDAKRCARRVHNDWDPSLEKVEWEVPAALQMRFDAGIEFEKVIFAQLRERLGATRCVDLSELRDKQEVIAATVRAMDDGTEMILGGWLPDDVEGGRTGRPDILLRFNGGYVPGDVKAHKTVARRSRGELTYSRLDDPVHRVAVAGWAAETTSRIDDYLQLAHYWRMLESLGRTPASAAVGFIIGTDDLSQLGAEGHLLTWLELDGPLFETYSRSRGRAKRTALERYDHEQRFRRDVARAAVLGEPALVEPIFTAECDACPWYDHCRDIADDDVASAQITSGRLSVREWRALAAVGVATLDQLAAVDPDDPGFEAAYLPEVTHIRHPLERVGAAVRRARMLAAGVTIERETSGPIEVPRADVEIDFDIEWDPDDRVYLWGALVHRDGEPPRYHAVVSWDLADDSAVADLAREFVVWLRSQVRAAAADGKSLLVYHYAQPEPTYLKRILGDEAVRDLLPHFVDLLPIVREHFFGVEGLGIKKVAPAFGFEWRDDDPGGLQSQLWLVEARTAEDEATRVSARERILAYNEDDVRATAAVRNGL
jgi:predicted RecB family nuclease